MRKFKVHLLGKCGHHTKYFQQADFGISPTLQKS